MRKYVYKFTFETYHYLLQMIDRASEIIIISQSLKLDFLHATTLKQYKIIQNGYRTHSLADRPVVAGKIFDMNKPTFNIQPFSILVIVHTIACKIVL